jgi:hypothetical protein
MSLTDALNYEHIQPGHTVWLAGGTYAGDFVSRIIGSANASIRLVGDPGDRPIIDGSLIINGACTDWYNVEIMKSGWTRQTEIAGSDPADISGGGLTIHGARTRMYGCKIHDVQTVGFWSDAIDAILDSCHIYHVGWLGPDRGHGHSMYSQNATGTKIVKNCIFHDSFGNGPIVYGSSRSTLVGYVFQNNVSFRGGSLANEPTNGFLIGGEAGAVMGDIVFDGNMTYPGNYGASIGYNSGGDNITITNNYLPDGIHLHLLTNVVESGNVYDVVGNVVFIYPYDWTTGRGTVVIYNEAEAESVSVDVSAVLDDGDDYTLTNAQDPDDVATGTLSGTDISIDMRAVSHSVASPVNWDAPATTFPTFGCFILEKTA